MHFTHKDKGSYTESAKGLLQLEFVTTLFLHAILFVLSILSLFFSQKVLNIMHKNPEAPSMQSQAKMHPMSQPLQCSWHFPKKASESEQM